MEVRVRRWGAALMLAGLVAGASGVVIAQEDPPRSDPGWVTRQIQGLLSGPGRTVTIGRVSSSWTLDVTIHDLAIADDEGVWLNVDQAKLDWAAGALFRREFRISGLDVNHMTLERLPASQPEPPPSDEPFSLPQLPNLPVGLDLQRLAVKQLDLGAPVLGGEAASLTIDGSARLGRAEDGAAANLKIDRLDKPGGAKLVMDYAPGDEHLNLDLTVEEPEGGVIARAARHSGPSAGQRVLTRLRPPHRLAGPPGRQRRRHRPHRRRRQHPWDRSRGRRPRLRPDDPRRHRLRPHARPADG